MNGLKDGYMSIWIDFDSKKILNDYSCIYFLAVANCCVYRRLGRISLETYEKVKTKKRVFVDL